MTTTREEAFMNLSPPRFGREGVPAPTAKYSPGNFLDTHIDANLILRRVELHPTLLTELSQLVDEKLENFPNRHLIPDDIFGRPPTWYRRSADMNTAEAIAKTQEMGAGFVASQLASSLLVHVTQPDVIAALTWGPSQLETCNQHSSTPFLVEHFFLRFIRYHVVSPDVLEQFIPEMRPKLVLISKELPHFAVAMFFCPAAHDLLRNMDTLIEAGDFAWGSNSDTENPPPATKVSRPVDNPHPPWTLPELTPVLLLDRKIRRSSRKNSPVVDYCSPGRVTASIEKKWHGDPAQYVQRAWANAVRADSSVIIFDCGNYLRIGIRHRETQTLLLSELVDVCTRKDPAYGKIWAGIHLAIVDDALQRFWAALELKSDPTPVLGEKRPSPDPDEAIADDTQPSKRAKSAPRPKRGAGKRASKDTAQSKDVAGALTRKITSSNPKMNNNTVTTVVPTNTPTGTLNQMNALLDSFSRHVAIALYLRVDIYNSPSPSILLRPGKRRSKVYSSTSYVTLILTTRLGTGATGDVFSGAVPHAKYGPVVVKLATTFKRLCRLRHEYTIYSHLQAANVQCIPRVFGFYQDAHHNVGALILSNDGEPLGNRHTKLTPSDKNSLRDSLRSIHAAGVLHRDLRVWNLLVNAKGHISIIDFDRATTSASAHEFQREEARLDKFLRGEYIDDGEIIGTDGMPANIGTLVNDNEDAQA
ncbi:hypothetical protein BDZ89DRAFT_1113657 [Hymenopellis radicata]|nr:hypothetical protein BDZ89DRAFT_1113657 [Hymenopellis radicata]